MGSTGQWEKKAAGQVYFSFGYKKKKKIWGEMGGGDLGGHHGNIQVQSRPRPGSVKRLESRQGLNSQVV